MDVKKFNKKLHKISSLTDAGNTELEFSALERDLLLSYIRELYEIVLDTDATTAKKPVVTKHEEVFVAPKVPEVAIKEPKVDSYSTPKVELEPRIEPIKAIEVIPNPTIVEPTVFKQEIVSPSIAEKGTETPKAPIALNNELLVELFADEKVSDLSDKLALAPVQDLTKSMGINERIFTQQELFGNNQSIFNETLVKLNSCQNFEEAQQYLLDNIINTYGWATESKVKKAATFIKLVKRKFST